MDKSRWEDGARVATAAEGSPVAVVAIAPPLLQNRVGERKSDGQRRKDDPFSSPPSYKAPTSVEHQPPRRQQSSQKKKASGVEQKDECAPSTAIREISLLKEMHHRNIVRIICLSKSFVSHCDFKLQPDSVSDCSFIHNSSSQSCSYTRHVPFMANEISPNLKGTTLSQLFKSVVINKSQVLTSKPQNTPKAMAENDPFCYPYHIDYCMPQEKWSKGLDQHSETLPRNSVRNLIIFSPK
ncbi:hypothetical protein PIB30_098149, partial [Stylosanthes scabra]|nr:hypothetical protein [Stylosanthes scabra]